MADATQAPINPNRYQGKRGRFSFQQPTQPVQPVRVPPAPYAQDWFKATTPPGWGKTKYPARKWDPGYEMTYWENPLNIARAYWQIQNAGPDRNIPEWMDPKAVETAYKYMTHVQNTDEWVNWKYIHPEDPIRGFLQGMQQPNLRYLLTGSQYQDYQLANLAQTNPDEWTPDMLEGIRDPQLLKQMQEYQQTWAERVPLEDLPAWQKLSYHIQQSPIISGVTTMLPFAIAGAAAGPIGFLAPLALGGGLGALSQYSPTAANILSKLDLPAEWLEQGIGIASQIGGSAINPDLFGPLDEVLGHLDAAAQAAHLTATAGAGVYGLPTVSGGRVDITNLLPLADYTLSSIGKWMGFDTDPQNIDFTKFNQAFPQLNVVADEEGTEWVVGGYKPVTLDATGLSALVNARRELIKGDSPEQVIAKYSEQFGFSGEFTELVGHIAVDPLNLVPRMTAEGISLAARKSNPLLSQAMKGSYGVLAGWKKYGDYVKTKVLYTEATAIEKLAGGLTEQGLVKRVNIETAPTNPVSRFFYNMTHMTREAKGRAFLSMGDDNFRAMGDFRRGDPLGYLDLLDSVMKTTPGELYKIAPFLGAPEIGTVRQAMAGFKTSDFRAMAEAAQAPRSVVYMLASALDDQPENIIKALSKADTAENLFHEFVTKATTADNPNARALLQAIDENVFTPTALQEVIKAFTGDSPLPWHPDEMIARVNLGLSEHIADWSTKAFGLKEQGAALRFAGNLKRIQSILLLGYNPAYAINNITSNTVNMMSSGTLNFTPMHKINTWFDEFGFKSHRWSEGTGAEGGYRTQGPGEDILTKATMPAREGVAEKIIGKVEKLSPVTKASAAMEGNARNHSLYSATKSTHTQINRVGVGLSPMEPALLQDLNNLGVNHRVLYDLFEGEINNVKLDERLFGDVNKYDPYLHIREASQELGFNSAEGTEILRPMLDEIKTRSETAKTPAEVQAVYKSIRKETLDTIGKYLKEEATTRIQEVATNVSSAGFGEFMRIFENVDKQKYELMTADVRATAEAFAEADALRNLGVDPDFLDAHWDRHFEESDALHNQINEFDDFTTRGFLEGMDVDDVVVQKSLGLSQEIKGYWNDYHKKTRAAKKKIIKTKFKSDEAFQAAWKKMMKDQGKEYLRVSDETAKIYQTIDDTFEEMARITFGDDAGDAARIWRENIREMSKERTTLMAAQQDAMIDLGTAERRLAWTKWHQETYLPFMQEFFRKQNELATMYSRVVTGDGPPDIAPIPKVEEAAPAPESGRVAELRTQLEGLQQEVAKLKGEEVAPPAEAYVQSPNDQAEIARISAEYGNPMARENGDYVPGSEAHALAIIRQEFPEITALDQVSPEMARQAFEAREARHIAEGRGTTKVDWAEETQKLQKKLARKGGKIKVSDEGGTPPPTTAYGPYPAGVVENMAGVKYESMTQSQIYQQLIMPMLDNLESKTLAGADRVRNLQGIDLPEKVATKFNSYLEKIKGERATNKIAAVRAAETITDHALLNYSNQYGANQLAQVVYPYHFWYTRMMWEWFQNAFDRPAWFANYARLRNVFRNNMQTAGFPTRLRDKMAIPAPYLPSWAGGNVWVDPLRKFMPVEEFTGPIDQLAQSKSESDRNTEYQIVRWVKQGSVSENEAAEAFATRTGTLWERAKSQVEMDIAEEKNDPTTWINMIMSPALYLTLPAFMITGKDVMTGRSDTSQLPITRTGNALKTVTENTPLHAIGQMIGGILAYPETAWRKGAGLSEFGDWGEYYVDRQLSNMVAEGLIDPDTANKAMIERQGPEFEEATKRVELEMALKVPGALPTYAALHGAEVDDFIAASLFGWLPANLLPEGEMEQRQLKELYNLAWEKYNQGDDRAINDFFERYPQYESRMALFPESKEDRLRQFLISQIWDQYTDMAKVDQQTARETFGELFTDGFLDDPTGDYGLLDVPTLAYWSRAMRGDVPNVPETQAIVDAPDIMFSELQFAPPAEAAIVENYRTLRNELFPGWYALQTWYFSYDNKADKKKFLAQFPQLKEYWDWNTAQKETNPVITKYTSQPAEDVVEFYDLGFVKDFSQPLVRQLYSYYLLGDSLAAGTRAELLNAWARNGRPGGDFDTFLNNVLKDAVAP